jgi:iron donor protein CyaY
MFLMDDQEFRNRAEFALESLKTALIAAESDADMEVEEQSGALHISFEEPEGRFVISPNSAARQIWISALSTSFKLDWTDGDWVLTKTGEHLKPLVGRLINQQLGAERVSL